MKESITILKLTNGENIIGKVVKSDQTIDISLPLKFMLMPKMTETGPAEALSLSPWIHPLTDEEYITINSLLSKDINIHSLDIFKVIHVYLNML